QTYIYDSFGQIAAQVGALPNPYTYTAREHDQESGLYFYRSRYYDPSIGRFLQEDPFRGVLTHPFTLNRYPYVRNNPINRKDPFGLQGAPSPPPEPGLIHEDPIGLLVPFLGPLTRVVEGANVVFSAVAAAAGKASVTDLVEALGEFFKDDIEEA